MCLHGTHAWSASIDKPMKRHLLFICSGNVNRSPTAESLFSNSRFYEAKSAGTDQHAVVRVSQDLIAWADVVFVMSEKEDGHLTFIQNNFSIKGKVSNFLVAEADASAIRDHNDFVVKGIVDIGQPLIGTRRILIDLSRTFHVQGLMGTFVVEDLDKIVEAGLPAEGSLRQRAWWLLSSK